MSIKICDSLDIKELEAQIAGLDFDIGQEKQRNYTYLSPESVEKYLNSIICGDIQEMPVRKLIVKAFVREVILDNDNVTITYNFTENYTKYRVTQEIIQKVQRQSRKKTAYNKNLCSYKLPSLPPRQTESRLNPRLCYFCIKGVAGIIIDTEVYVPQWSDFYLTQKRDAHGNYTK